jgi:small subunit ribosomal protein S20
LSAKKRIRQNIKARARNRYRKDLIKAEVKAFTAAITAGNADQAGEALKKVASRLDKVAAKHTIHKNAAARRRSRLAKRLNALRSGAGTKGGAVKTA